MHWSIAIEVHVNTPDSTKLYIFLPVELNEDVLYTYMTQSTQHIMFNALFTKNVIDRCV